MKSHNHAKHWDMCKDSEKSSIFELQMIKKNERLGI